MRNISGEVKKINRTRTKPYTLIALLMFSVLICCFLVSKCLIDSDNNGNETVVLELGKNVGNIEAARNSDGTYTIIHVDYAEKRLEMPDLMPDGNPITAMSFDALNDLHEVETIVLPDGLLELRLDIFNNCPRLKEIDFGSALNSIRTFYNLDLTLKKVVVSEHNQHFINSGNAIVEKETGRIVLVADGFSFSSDMRTIGKCAFSYSNVENLDIPDNIYEIEEAAFIGCINLKSVVIPDSVSEIKDKTFCNCINLRHIDIPASVTCIGEYAFASTAISSIPNFGKAIEIKPMTFYGCQNLVNIVVPDGILIIRDNAFNNCIHLKTVVLPDNLEKIETSGLFGMCQDLEKVTISSNNAFYYSDHGCLVDRMTKTLVVGVNNGYIPPDIRIIGDWAFSGRAHLTSIRIPSGVSEIRQFAFFETSELEYIFFPSSIIKVENNVLSDNSDNLIIEFEEGITMDGWNSMWKGG